MNTRFVGPEFFTNYCKFFSIQLSSMIGRRDAHFQYLGSVLNIHCSHYSAFKILYHRGVFSTGAMGALAPTILEIGY